MNKVRVMVENGLWDIKCHKDEKNGTFSIPNMTSPETFVLNYVIISFYISLPTTFRNSINAWNNEQRNHLITSFFAWFCKQWEVWFQHLSAPSPAELIDPDKVIASQC